MSLAQALSSYMTLNLLIILGFCLTKLVFYFCKKLKISITSKAQLEINYLILLTAVLITLVHPLIPKNDFFVPTAKVWSTESVKNFYTQYKEPDQSGYFSVFIGGDKPLIVNSDLIIYSWWSLGLCILFFGSLFLSRDLLALYRVRKNSFLFKKIGNVHIYLNDKISVPFSYRARRAHVVIPTGLVAKKEDFKISVSHEIQHHRQLDTVWVYGFWMLKLICLLNPFIYLWIQEISEIQEFACDEALIGQKKIDSQIYARCLLEVAQTATHQDRHLVCAIGLTFLIERNLLKRRIESMFNQKMKTKKPVKVALIAFFATVMTLTAYATTSLVQDRRVTFKEAQAFAQNAKMNSHFPIVVNELVLKELNRYIGTPEGREFMRKALARMETYKPMVQRKMNQYQLPEELLAIPLIESGYQNLPQSENKSWGAGLWMFIESTAVSYGLRVDSVIDERLEPEILTDAAMRYLSANQLRFKDWPLATLAYNIGESKVQEGINKLKTRDAWLLTRNGYQGEQYLARLMAAILIMKNPESVE